MPANMNELAGYGSKGTHLRTLEVSETVPADGWNILSLELIK